MAGNRVTLTFAGDSKSLERTFDRVGSGAKEMASDLDSAQGKARTFGSAMDGVGESVGSTESKFMGTADLLDGLGGAFGLPTEGATSMMRAFGDLSGGFQVVQQTMGTMATFMSGQLRAAMSVIAAHPVLFAIGALATAFITAYTQSETFRNFINGLAKALGGALLGAVTTLRDVFVGAFRTISEWAGSVFNFFWSVPQKMWAVAQGVFDALIWPYKTAFNMIAKLWNNTVGQLSFSVPSWVPGIGGKGFSMPRLPTFHMGGVVPGNPGTPVPIMALAGETVTRAGQGGGVTVVVNFNGVVGDPAAAARQIDTILRNARNRGVIPA